MMVRLRKTLATAVASARGVAGCMGVLGLLGLFGGMSMAQAAQPAADQTPAAPVMIDGGLYGKVVLVKPEGKLRGFVVLFSGRDGWHAEDQRAADALAHNGAMVVGVDTPRYAAKLAVTSEDKSGCHYLVGDAEAVSHQLQREAHSTQYFLPILAGVGQGALLAERTLGRAPSNTLSGVALLDADTQLDARFNPCAPDATIDRGKGLPGFLETGVTGAGGANGAASAPRVASASASAVTAAGGSAFRRFQQGTTEADAMVALVGPHLLADGNHDNDVSDLPLIELPAAQPTDMLAIVISGDGGWRDLDKTIAEALQKKGVSVVGVDALRYFWRERSPQQTAHDMARVLQAYSARWHTRHIALIGYSFGADVMPFIYNRLPDPLRAQVSQISLLGFSPKADFQIRVTGWLGMPASDQALLALPETAKVPIGLLQCFYGKDEEDTACPDLVKSGATVIRTDGGHHFGGDYGDLASTILTRWRAQIAKTGG